ncbi:MAG: dipeptide ABC transporter ATP-binding protein [Burkholderiales bacterium]
MAKALLEVKNLRTWLASESGSVRAVDDMSFDVPRGETFALLGESGCGKSMTALSIMRLLPESGQIIDGEIRLEGQDLMELPEAKMREIRGRRISMIFQEPGASLNPVMTVHDQIAEAITRHSDLRGEKVGERVIELLNAVRIPDAAQRAHEYPFQLSGGMKQRVMIAIALAGKPELLVADEPTTALDVTIQAQVLELLRELQAQNGMAILLITHDLGVVSEMATHVAVMYAGELVEIAPRERFFAHPAHPYSQKLFAALPGRTRRNENLDVIRGTVPPLDQEFTGCRFADRCDFAWELCHSDAPKWSELGAGQRVRCHLYEHEGRGVSNENETPRRRTAREEPKSTEPLLAVEDLKVHFPVRRGLFKTVVGHVKAVDGVSLKIRPGKTLALVGESGCGKTTVGKAIVRLLHPTAGRVSFGSNDLATLSGKSLRALRSQFQIVFQDPYASLNPRMRVNEIISEGMGAMNVVAGASARNARVEELLSQVGLRPEHKFRYPHEFSGGQRQRIAIARALSVNPRLIVCDEPTSALDVSVQAQILNLLKRLQDELGLSYLFITHNIAVVEFLAHEVAVMYLGRIVERGTVEEVLQAPKHPYTQALLSAVPVIQRERKIIRLEGDMPSPINPPQGCHFNPRCSNVVEVCREKYPDESCISETRKVSCHLY